MKFFKKYILTFISGIILASLFYLFNSLIPGINSTRNVIRIVASGVYFSFYLLLIRVIDDIHDYPTDIINKKNVFKIKTLYALLILFLVILLTISIISSLGYQHDWITLEMELINCRETLICHLRIRMEK